MTKTNTVPIDLHLKHKGRSWMRQQIDEIYLATMVKCQEDNNQGWNEEQQGRGRWCLFPVTERHCMALNRLINFTCRMTHQVTRTTSAPHMDKMIRKEWISFVTSRKFSPWGPRLHARTQDTMANQPERECKRIFTRAPKQEAKPNRTLPTSPKCAQPIRLENTYQVPGTWQRATKRVLHKTIYRQLPFSWGAPSPLTPWQMLLPSLIVWFNSHTKSKKHNTKLRTENIN